MKYINRITLLILIIALSTGCGTEAPPTMSGADVQSTAIAAAFTIVAETQAAIPTSTPLPPTETPTSTPLPTNTSLSLPTLAATLTSVPAAGSGSGDPCATRVLGAPLGKSTVIRIVNTVKQPVTVSLYLNETASHNECGYRGYNLSQRGSVVITDLVVGCYNLWAWSTGDKPFNSSGYGCINNPDKWTFEINEATIKFIGP